MAEDTYEHSKRYEGVKRKSQAVAVEETIARHAGSTMCENSDNAEQRVSTNIAGH